MAENEESKFPELVDDVLKIVIGFTGPIFILVSKKTHDMYLKVTKTVEYSGNKEEVISDNLVENTKHMYFDKVLESGIIPSGFLEYIIFNYDISLFDKEKISKFKKLNEITFGKLYIIPDIDDHPINNIDTLVHILDLLPNIKRCNIFWYGGYDNKLVAEGKTEIDILNIFMKNIYPRINVEYRQKIFLINVITKISIACPDLEILHDNHRPILSQTYNYIFIVSDYRLSDEDLKQNMQNVLVFENDKYKKYFDDTQLSIYKQIGYRFEIKIIHETIVENSIIWNILKHINYKDKVISNKSIELCNEYEPF